MERYTFPPDSGHRPESPEPQNPLKMNKLVVVVEGGDLHRFGLLEQALACLKHMGLEVETFEDSNPSA